MSARTLGSSGSGSASTANHRRLVRLVAHDLLRIGGHQRQVLHVEVLALGTSARNGVTVQA